jgi:hypothetical protein
MIPYVAGSNHLRGFHDGSFLDLGVCHLDFWCTSKLEPMHIHNILGLLRTVKTRSNVYPLSFIMHYLMHAQKFGMRVHNVFCVRMQNEPKNLGANTQA